MENFDPEKVIRYDWNDKGIYSKDAAWDIMANEALVNVVQLVDAEDYDKLLALYRDKVNDVNVLANALADNQMTLTERYGSIEIK